MGQYVIGALERERAAGFYRADPVLRQCEAVCPPDVDAEPMGRAEREYFARVGDDCLRHRTGLSGELREAWAELRAAFVDDALFSRDSCEDPADCSVARIEALALLVRACCCRCDTATWAGYCVELRMALEGRLILKARAQGLRDPQECAHEFLFRLFDARMDPNAALPSDPRKASALISQGTPKFWRFDPRSYFSSWLDTCARNAFIDMHRKQQRGEAHIAHMDERRFAAIPSRAATDDEAAALSDQALDEILGGLNGIGIHPAFVRANIRALLDEQAALERGARGATAAIEARRAETQARVIYLEELATEPASTRRAAARAKERIALELADSPPGAKTCIMPREQRALICDCFERFMLFLVRDCGMDPGALIYWLHRSANCDKTSSDLKELQQRLAERLGQL